MQDKYQLNIPDCKPAVCIISSVSVLLRSLRCEDLVFLGTKWIRFILILRSKW